MSTSSRRRGRPPGPVTDLPAPHGYTHNPETRVGWLLRGWRLAAMPDSNARGFAALLNERGVSADASRVSRWETGQLPAPVEVVEAYEDLLGLPPGGLLGVTCFQRRVASGRPHPQVGLGPDRVRPGHVERVLDTAHDGEPTGREWFELGMTAATLGDGLVLPRSFWQRITSRLVDELGRAVGNAYVSRGEAAILLTRHPGSRRALVLAVGENVTSPDNLLLTDPMTILQEIDGQQANDLVLRLLEQPTPVVRNAAAWAAAAKVVRGHFAAEELRRLEATVARAVEQQRLDDIGTFARLVDLVAVLPRPAQQRILRRSGLRADPAAPGEPTVDPAAARRVVAEILAEAGRDDPMFVRLAERVLCHPVAELRFLAAFTVKEAACCGRLASGLAEQVRRHVDGEQVLGVDLLHRLMAALSILAGEDQRPLLHRIVAGSDPTPKPMALAALAHLSATPVPGLLGLVDGDEADIARTALYCAGMTEDPALDVVADDVRLPDWKRRAARWWRGHGGAIREPAPDAPVSADPGVGTPQA